MDVALDLSLAVWLLFTTLALVLSSISMRLQGAKGEQLQGPLAPEPAQESDPRDQEAGRERLPVEEVMAVEEEKEPASTAATPAPMTSTAASFESSGGFEWPLGTLETCLLIVMGITILHAYRVCFTHNHFVWS
ncbi:hypothetical protein AAES_05448 [Amazona aestiva]|uniref:Matrix-remodeling-associated protein 7 n=1 Tax=Amazona aestiva TaxID=12930 RepID=A0A0Q3U4I2_AMAAE|nr:hypothetical protein AAES_05448 [Amazona aestiva]